MINLVRIFNCENVEVPIYTKTFAFSANAVPYSIQIVKFKIKSNKKIFEFTNNVIIKNLPFEYIKVERDNLTIFSKNVGHYIQPNFQDLSFDYMYEFSFNYLDHLNIASL